MKLEKRRL
jgi:hypothetical protein